MTTHPLPAVVLFVADVQRLADFYCKLAEFAVVHQDADHAVLERDGFQLVLHALRGEPAPALLPDGMPALREDSYTKLCLPVTTIAKARSQAAALGGFIKPDTHTWQARDFRACDGHDPEGNVLQVREPLR